jgi:hypothetical protein
MKTKIWVQLRLIQHVCIPADCAPAISHKLKLTKPISETETFNLSDASLEFFSGLIFTNLFCTKNVKVSPKLIFERRSLSVMPLSPSRMTSFLLLLFLFLS